MQRLVVIGNGMVGHELVRLVSERGAWSITVLAEEPRPAYDRVHLSSWFDGRTDLALADAAWYAARGVALRLGEPARVIDRAARRVNDVPYDALVLATGSRPFVPPIPGAEGPGRFVYRTIEDLEAIAVAARGRRTGIVIGGGLLGLEAAGALAALGLDTHVVELAPRLMPMQLDDDGAALLRRAIEAKGIHVHLGRAPTAITDPLRLEPLGLDADLIVFSAGIRPRDDLARAAGLPIGARGGIAIDDACRCDPDIYAIGECASWRDRVFGLVGPGYAMARVAAAQLAGEALTFTGADTSTKLKLLGVEVASFGELTGSTSGGYRRLLLDDDGKLRGGILVGDTSEYAALHARLGKPLDAPAAGGTVCTCNNVDEAAIVAAVKQGACDVAAVKACTRAGTGCGGCVPAVSTILARQLGITRKPLCEHFAHTRQELVHLVKIHRLRTFAELLARHGTGHGCEICRPTVASILASTWNDHVLDPAHAPLQDTNDAFLANIQKDGTYSVVPRVPGGEITPDKLIAIGMVAKKYDLYTKITGGQRIDLFGAKLHELPAIWRELIDAGFESGHAYGKAVRTVKTCVGSTWCRYGVQDSVGLGIRLEDRYKGLRAPHKLKLGVSGCTRECAEARGKDVGVIATEQGYNLYVCGNGGARPRHADLLATDLDEARVVTLIDRFLMFYVRTADRLQRTAPWLESLDGGLDYLRRVIVDDALGIAAELEAEMAAFVATYRCEWRATVEDPAKLARFRTFVNTDHPDPELTYARERGQRFPALRVVR